LSNDFLTLCKGKLLNAIDDFGIWEGSMTFHSTYEEKAIFKSVKAIVGTVLILSLILLSGCATIPVEKRPQLRTKLLNIADEVLVEFIAADPDIEAAFHKSVGYFIGEASMGMFALVGSGGSIGVLYDKRTNDQTFLDINTIDIGVGVAGSDFKLLILFKTPEALDEVKKGFRSFGLAAASMAGKYGGIAHAEREDWAVYVHAKSGASLGASLTLTRVEINTELTEVGVSEVGIPNKGLAKRDRQGETAPRKWNRALPFLAQKVVNKGYDLPLPYGVGLTVAGVDQEMDLSNLSAGFNGGPMRQFPSVSLNNSETDTQSLLVKLDAWLFPFMNVFGMVGQVRGDFTMDVGIDGNTILNEIGETCGGLIQGPLCRLLQDKVFTLPIKTDVDALTYGVGTTLAAGWNNWFVTIPMSANWTKPKGPVADGVAYTITPRAGRIVNLGRFGNIAAFGGGNYLKAKYTLTGNFNVPDSDLSIDYIINQESRDNWNLLIGYNWDISRRISWAFEYNGFIGSRKSWISSLVYRF
ncbi:MAG: lipid-binding SYLF domain-containing protein, partial [Planctomycetota bacterium]